MNDQTTVLITGSTGFVGAALVKQLASLMTCQVRALVRSKGVVFAESVTPVYVGSDYLTSGNVPLTGVDVLIHCAARVHVMSDASSDPLSEYRKINVDGTLNLAKQAAQSGVKRFIFISSIKVNGEETQVGTPFTAEDIPAPSDPYGVSKMEAEQQLMSLGKEIGMEIVVIRPVLVYGPGVKANFRSMMNWLNKGWPLPLGAIRNQRSFVALENLIDLIITCIEHPGAANQVFLASDGYDMSTTQLLKQLGEALGRPARLIPVPVSILVRAASLLGRRSAAQRLCGSLQVDIQKSRDLLGWSPPSTVENALRKTASNFQSS
ncbi:UDP-glucose 4-epimerase family protein [Pseudomonas sp. TMW22091]|uniref:UDP-glucose 4-epimerase family protein n=1 Tax=Pseudomonas sp. TMW22091 TaxID=2506435 RepID=UPI001F0DB116|nr:SDR family oxidoreductase [Pseudomonas sp. TMW22091]